MVIQAATAYNGKTCQELGAEYGQRLDHDILVAEQTGKWDGTYSGDLGRGDAAAAYLYYDIQLGHLTTLSRAMGGARLRCDGNTLFDNAVTHLSERTRSLLVANTSAAGNQQGTMTSFDEWSEFTRTMLGQLAPPHDDG